MSRVPGLTRPRRRDEYRPVADQKYARRHGHIHARLKDDRRGLREIQQITENWKRASATPTRLANRDGTG
jgi:hypothetical protein